MSPRGVLLFYISVLVVERFVLMKIKFNLSLSIVLSQYYIGSLHASYSSIEKDHGVKFSIFLYVVEIIFVSNRASTVGTLTTQYFC